MKKRLSIALLIGILSIPGAVFSQDGNPGDAVETTSSGKIDWTAGEIYATGIGAPPARAANAAQARAMAQRAAFVVALRNLLEVVKGVRVDSESIVENFMVKSDVIRTRVDGIVKGARIVKTQYMSDGSVEVQVAMPLKGPLMEALVPDNFGRPSSTQVLQKPLPQAVQPLRPAVPAPSQKPPEPARPEPQKPTPTIPASPAPEKKAEPTKPSPPPLVTPQEKKPEPRTSEPSKPAIPSEGEPTAMFKGGVATGLVIDGRGLGLRPALLPKIVDPQGQEIYVGQVATRTNAVEQGVAGYAKDVNAAANNFRVTDNPAVIKGQRASGTAKTDVMVSQADAQTLRQLGNRGDFLQYCRVIIVY
jgi:hypothetical protein